MLAIDKTVQKEALFYKIAGLLGLLFFFSLFCFLLKPSMLLGVVRDDDMFYLKVAENFSRGFGSTFDQIQPTNGYHPFWMLCLSSLFFILDRFSLTSPEIHFRIALLSNCLVITATIALAFSIIKRISGETLSKITIFMVLLYMVIFPFSVALLSDGILVTFLIVLTLHQCFHEKFNRALCIIPFIFLTRIDLLPLAIFFCSYITFKDRKKGILSFLLLFFAVGAYLFVNYHYFGHILTVSSYVKTQIWMTRIDMQRTWKQTMRLIGRIGVLTMYYLIALLFYFYNRKHGNLGKDKKRFYTFLFVVASGGFLYIWAMNFLNANLRDWYFIWPLTLTGLFLFTGMNIFSYRISSISMFHINIPTRKILLMFFLFVAISSAAAVVKFAKRDWHNSHYYYALWLKEQVLEEEPVLQIDSAGIICFFSQRKIVSADGLICSFDYVDKLYTGRLHEFLKEKNIKYVAIDERDRRNYIPNHDKLKYHGGNILDVTLFKKFKDEYFLYQANQ